MSTELASRIDGLVHEETQVHDGGVDLTVATVWEVVGPGGVDFGGGELSAAALEAVETHRRNPDDDYGWWHLTAGTYLLEYNETVAGEEPLHLQVRRELRERGASHPTLVAATPGRVPLTVGGAGIRLKENARVSTLRPR